MASQETVRAGLCVAQRGVGGTPLLLLHGIGGGKSTWTQVAELIAPARWVITPDLLGFGHSAWPDLAYTVDDHLAAITRLLAALGLDQGPLDVAGHSMGAILAAELAARQADRVQRLTLVSLPYFRSEEEARDSIARLGGLARLTVLGHWAAGVVCGVMCALRPQLRFLAPHFAPHVPAEVARDAVMHNFGTYSRSLQHVIVEHRLEPALERLRERDVLLVHGDADQAAPVERVRQLAARFPRWRLVVVPGADHHLPIAQPEVVARLLQTPG